jgi:hypothetical protein
MKTFLPFIFFISCSFSITAQWDLTGNNYTTGKLAIGKSTPNRAIDILSTSASGGIDIYNTNTSGMSSVLVGEGNQGRYLYMSYNNSLYPAFGAFKQASAILYTGAPNGMRIISDQALSIITGGSADIHERVRILPNGNIGIGTIDPDKTLTIKGEIGFFRSVVSPTGSSAGFIKYEDGFYFGNRSTGDPLRFQTNSIDRLFIRNDGNIGIGTSDPDAKLTVAGDIHSREVRVTINAGVGPDFVFQDNYDLKTLAEVEKFIKENKHLPDIESAKVMENEGLELGKMDMKLLQKIEELTIYMIDFKKEMDGIKQENQKLKDRIVELEKK